MSKITLSPRSAQRQEDTWDVTSVFSNTAAWETEYQLVQAELPAFEKYHGKLNGPAILSEALDAFFQVIVRVQKLSMYAELLTSVDTHNEEAAALISRAATLDGQVSWAGECGTGLYQTRTSGEWCGKALAVGQLRLTSGCVYSLFRGSFAPTGACAFA
jgi:hypothetical protein